MLRRVAMGGWAMVLAAQAATDKGATDLRAFEAEVRRPMRAERAEAWARSFGAGNGGGVGGAPARVEMPLTTARETRGRVAFLLREPAGASSGGAKTAARGVAVVVPPDAARGAGTKWTLRRIAPGLWGGGFPVADGDAFRYRYTLTDAAGQTRAMDAVRTFEAYRMPPEMSSDPKAPKGELREMPPHASEVYPGTARPWWIYLPPGFGKTPAPSGGYDLIVWQDGQWAKGFAPTCLDNMIARGTLRPTVAVFVKPGSHSAESGGKDGDNRAREYDVMSDEYARMLLQEILPKVQTIAPLTKDPARRAIAGESSGGICAFTAAWERPESFGLVMSHIGSYVNIAALFGKPGGQNYPAFIRRTERKPIRIVLQDGEQDLDNEWGNWPLANLTMRAALAYKGYDVRWLWGRGFHSGAHGRAELPASLEWLFRTGRYAGTKTD